MAAFREDTFRIESSKGSSGLLTNRQYVQLHPEESSENTCDFNEIRKYVWAFIMGVYEK